MSGYSEFHREHALTDEDFRAELRRKEVNAFKSVTKYSSDDDVIERLAYCADREPLKYEHLREYAARRLDCRPSVLDKVVKERRKPKKAEKLVPAERPRKDEAELQGSAVLCSDVEPWPEAADGAAVLNEVAGAFTRYVVVPEGAADMLALWCAHTHCYGLFTCSPRLNITSPDRGCGKTTLRDVVREFVYRPFSCENATTATIFRLIAKFGPTLLLDECDAWLRDNEELRGILNSGHRRGGCLPRCEGDSNELRVFPTFAPSVLCGIGDLPGTLHDRSIVVRLTCAKPGELRARFDSRYTEKEKELNRKLARWTADNRGRISGCDPTLPEGVCNRLGDNWRPLFAIAQLAGGDWPKRCRETFMRLSSRNLETESYRIMLLSDIQPIVHDAIENGNDWLASTAVIESLVGDPERPWNEVNRGKAINERWLARKLDPIKPGRFRYDDCKQMRGYRVADLQDAIERFITPPVTNGQMSQTREPDPF